MTNHVAFTSGPASLSPENPLLLVAEDNPLTQRIIQMALSKIFKIIFVSNAGDAISEFEKNWTNNTRFDAVLMDIEMPMHQGEDIDSEAGIKAVLEIRKIELKSFADTPKDEIEASLTNPTPIMAYTSTIKNVFLVFTRILKKAYLIKLGMDIETILKIGKLKTADFSAVLGGKPCSNEMLSNSLLKIIPGMVPIPFSSPASPCKDLKDEEPEEGSRSENTFSATRFSPLSLSDLKKPL